MEFTNNQSQNNPKQKENPFFSFKEIVQETIQEINNQIFQNQLNNRELKNINVTTQDTPIIEETIWDIKKNSIKMSIPITGLCYLEVDNTFLIAIFQGFNIKIYFLEYKQPPVLQNEIIIKFQNAENHQKNNVSIISGCFGMYIQKDKAPYFSIIAGSENGEVYIIVLGEDFPVNRQKLSESPVKNIIVAIENQFYKYENLCLIQTLDTQLYLYNYKNGVIVARFRVGQQCPSFAVSIDWYYSGQYFMCANSDASIEFWQINTDIIQKIEQSHEQSEEKKKKFYPVIQNLPYTFSYNSHKYSLEGAQMFGKFIVTIDIQGIVQMWTIDADFSQQDNFLTIFKKKLHGNGNDIKSFQILNSLDFDGNYYPKLQIGMNDGISIFNLEDDEDQDQKFSQTIFKIDTRGKMITYLAVSSDQSHVFGYYEDEFYYYCLREEKQPQIEEEKNEF